MRFQKLVLTCGWCFSLLTPFPRRSLLGTVISCPWDIRLASICGGPYVTYSPSAYSPGVYSPGVYAPPQFVEGTLCDVLPQRVLLWCVRHAGSTQVTLTRSLNNVAQESRNRHPLLIAVG